MTGLTEAVLIFINHYEIGRMSRREVEDVVRLLCTGQDWRKRYFELSGNEAVFHG